MRAPFSAGPPAPFAFTMAFQPIVDVEKGSVFAYEALMRTLDGRSGGVALNDLDRDERFDLDRRCRLHAIELSQSLGLLDRPGTKLSVNFLPGTVYQPENCPTATLKAANRLEMPFDRMVFEICENERIVDRRHLREMLLAYDDTGLQIAFDDFGAGFCGLGLLADFQPHIVKLDMALVSGIDADAPRRAIVAGAVGICRTLGIDLVAEGVETRAEMATLRKLGVTLMQGYLFARPGLACLPEPAIL
jgi:EAL domain-containing protein (putative c-di-GMP-specific phosphodiesterase class I)